MKKSEQELVFDFMNGLLARENDFGDVVFCCRIEGLRNDFQAVMDGVWVEKKAIFKGVMRGGDGKECVEVAFFGKSIDSVEKMIEEERERLGFKVMEWKIVELKKEDRFERLFIWFDEGMCN